MIENSIKHIANVINEVISTGTIREENMSMIRQTYETMFCYVDKEFEDRWGDEEEILEEQFDEGCEYYDEQ